MKKTTLTLLTLLLTATFTFAQDPDWHQIPKEDLLGNRGEIARTIQSSTDESKLLEVWQRPETDEGVLYLKMLAAKRLGMYGTKAAVPVLVARLGDAPDSFYARYALETIPGTEVDVALGEVLKTLKTPGEIAGVLTTLGVRANPVSAEVVKSFLTHENADVRRAAGYAYALTLGNNRDTFFTDRNLDPIFIDSAFLFAEQLAKQGDSVNAMRVYYAIFANSVYAKEYQKMAALYQGALARGLAGADWLFQQVKHDSPRRLFEVGLKAGRELPVDARATTMKTVAHELIRQIETQTDPLRSAKMVRSLGDRKDRGSKALALPLITILATGKYEERIFDVPVRVAAIDALRNVGDASVLPVLIAAATQTEEQRIANAARNTLIEMSSDGIDAAILAALRSGGTSAVKIALMNIIAERRIFAASPIILTLLKDSDAAVSGAAVSALGQISGIEDLPVLLGLLKQAQSEAETKKILDVLKSACTRFSQEAAATEVAKALDGASAEQKTQLLDLLKEIAGTKALDIVSSYAWGDDAAMRNVGTRILGEWRSPPDLDQLAAACLKLAKESQEYKIRGLRGYIRLARQFDMPEDRRLEMCQIFYGLAERDEDRLLIFDVFSRLSSVKALEKATSYLDKPALREKAAETAVVIGTKLQGRQPQGARHMEAVVKATQNAETKQRAEALLTRFGGGNEGIVIVKAIYGAGDKTADVTAKVRNLSAGSSTFDIGSYNGAFGDPVPQVVKTLTITYKVKDGPERTATFAENRPIVLPLQ